VLPRHERQAAEYRKTTQHNTIFGKA
jgi:hypothetical protein